MDSARGRAYQARPGRPAVVAADLADLHGPGTGMVELPLRLFWSLPGHRFDLGDQDMRLWLYQTVLREATRPEELATHLNTDLLVVLWPELYLPRGIRLAWEDHHPQLRATVPPVATGMGADDPACYGARRPARPRSPRSLARRPHHRPPRAP